MALQRTRGLSPAQFLWFAGCGPAVHALFGAARRLNAVALGGPDADGGVREPREVLLPPAVAC
jgi:hypothetical protein